MDYVNEPLYFPEGGLRITYDRTRDLQGYEPTGQEITFQLCRKPISFRAAKFDHWWLDTKSLYGQRNASSRNGKAVVACYQSLCMCSGAILSDEAQSILLLARLLPVVRSNGGRMVFCDAHPNNRGQKYDRTKILDGLLRESRSQEMSPIEFQKATADVLGPTEVTSDAQQRYNDLVTTVLEPALGEFASQGWQAAIDCAKQRWHQWHKSFGRRSGYDAEKQALNIFSYECRTALHTCYSAAWCELIRHLAEKYDWTEEAILFHRLWHLDLIDRLGDERLPNNRLFHGHIFGLHPAAANFVSTATGCELIGDYLTSPADDAAFRRLLHGMYVAVHDYMNRIAMQTEGRARRTSSRPNRDLDRLSSKRRRTNRSRRS